MNIVYFTTAMRDSDFKSFSSKWTVPLNPSNQNFHNKMIRALALTNNVTVISLRPFSKKLCRIQKLVYETVSDGNIVWKYLSIPQNKLFVLNSCVKQAKEIIKKLDTHNMVFLFDTINQKTIYVANKIKSKFKVPAIGICTDDPRNISGVRSSFAESVFSSTKNEDAYICLTDGLNQIFNKHEKPSFIIEGLVEDRLPLKTENIYGDYIFFGGSLMMKYGIKELIKSFESLDHTQLKLVICGHHEEPWLKEKISRLPNAIYLGILPVQQVLELEQNAMMCINPRPFSDNLDKYSIPSKTIEYLSSGSITISCKNSKLEKYFKDNIIWCDSTIDGIKEAIIKVQNMNQKERDSFGLKAKEEVNKEFSLSSVNSKITSFLEQFVN